jgi:hypothetical protein
LFNPLIGPDVAGAQSQGTADATTAEGVASGLVLSGVAIIYKNLENYDPASVLPGGATCGSVVNAYLSSWDTKLHADFYSAGVYGNPIPAVDWQAHVSPLPDDAWIAQYPATGKAPAVTIWGIGTAYKMTDAMWPSYQRIHQYTNTHSEAWGNTSSFGIDGDIVNAEIVSNNNMTNYTYGYSNIDCTNLGALSVSPAAINDMSNGTLITGPGQMGTIVGSFNDSNYHWHGFQNVGGTCSSIDFPGAMDTFVYGINNLSQIVGYWYDGTNYHGFLKNPGSTPTQLNCLGGISTFYGINDASQIVGFAQFSNDVGQAFLYYKGQCYPVGSKSATGYTLAYGINGDATVTGDAPYSFEESLLPPSWTGTATPVVPGGNSSAYANAINANNELVGYYPSSACMNTDNVCGFLSTDNVVLTLLTYGNFPVTNAFGINDFGQIVGFYQDSLGNEHAALWAPQ